METAFKIRASQVHNIMAGTIGLTEKQNELLNSYLHRENGTGKPLTDKMKAELVELKNKKEKRELPQGAKTYCKKWLKHDRYGREEEIKSRYIEKGNLCEEDGFTLMALQLNLGMVYKNTERKSDDFFTGECDLFKSNIVYDNKCSWSLDTFPMFEEVCPDQKYIDQLQVYAELWSAKKMVLAYTLINAPYEMVENALKWELDSNKRYKIAERMIFTKDFFDEIKAEFFNDSTLNTFIEIPEKDRIRTFEFLPDKTFINEVKERVLLCRTYINQLLNN